MEKESKNELSFKDELANARYRAELAYISALYGDTSLLTDYAIDEKHFAKNSKWRNYYNLLKAMVGVGDYKELNAWTVDMFVKDKTSKAEQIIYKSVGGYEAIEESIELYDSANIKEYYSDVLKYSAIERLSRIGFDVEGQWSSLRSKSYEEIAKMFENVIYRVFEDFDIEEDRVKWLGEGMQEMVEKSFEGKDIGMPTTSRLLNTITNGMALGNITMLAAMSGVGKTTLTICLLLPKMLEKKEPVLIICNEEDETRWQREIITWIVNNQILKKENWKLNKQKFSNGKFNDEEKEAVLQAVEKYKEYDKDELIQIVSFKSFSTDKAIRFIEKAVKRHGVKHFILDTFKLDNDSSSRVTDNSWLQLQQNIVRIYNVVKPSENNAHIWLTYQINKSQRRYLDQTSLGVSKNVADVVSTLLLTRDVTTREKEEGQLAVQKEDKTSIMLREDVDYMVIFIDKNRTGPTNKQVVLGIDKGTNQIWDVGFTNIAEDF